MSIAIKGTVLEFFPVPKVACTSMKLAILCHNDQDQFNHIAEGPHESRPRHVHDVYKTVTFSKRTRKLKKPGEKWFCLVRDPIERFVSGYRHRILFHRELDQLPSAMLRLAGLGREPDLDEFAINIRKYSLLSRSMFHHFSPTTRYLGREPHLFDQVFRLSEMDQLVDYAASNGAPLDIPKVNDDGPIIDLNSLSPKASRSLEKHYRSTYQSWGQYFR